jgi:hypothetical protein
MRCRRNTEEGYIGEQKIERREKAKWVIHEEVYDNMEGESLKRAVISNAFKIVPVLY